MRQILITLLAVSFLACGKINDLEDDVKKLQKDMVELQKDVAEIKAKTKEQEAKFIQVVNDVKTSKTLIVDVNTQIKTLETNYTSILTKIKTLENTNGDYQEQIDQLKNLIDGSPILYYPTSAQQIKDSQKKIVVGNVYPKTDDELQYLVNVEYLLGNIYLFNYIGELNLPNLKGVREIINYGGKLKGRKNNEITSFILPKLEYAHYLTIAYEYLATIDLSSLIFCEDLDIVTPTNKIFLNSLIRGNSHILAHDITETITLPNECPDLCLKLENYDLSKIFGEELTINQLSLKMGSSITKPITINDCENLTLSNLNGSAGNITVVSDFCDLDIQNILCEGYVGPTMNVSTVDLYLWSNYNKRSDINLSGLNDVKHFTDCDIYLSNSYMSSTLIALNGDHTFDNINVECTFGIINMFNGISKLECKTKKEEFKCYLHLGTDPNIIFSNLIESNGAINIKWDVKPENNVLCSMVNYIEQDRTTAPITVNYGEPENYVVNCTTQE